MADNKKKVKIKKLEKKEVTMKEGDVKYEVSWDEQDVEFEGEGKTITIQAKVREKKESATEEPKNVTLKHENGFWSDKVKIVKLLDKEVKEEIGVGVKGFSTKGWIMIGVIVVVALALIVGLWYWMTRKSPEDEE